MARNADDEPLPGTIFLTKIGGVVGKIVWILQLFNGDFSRWTHVGMVLDDGDTFEAMPGGAVIGKLAARDGEPIAFIDWDLDAETREAIVATARELEGTPYSWLTYAYLAATRLHLPTAAYFMRERVEKHERLICSQAADLIYRTHGQHLFEDGRKPYDLTPGDFKALLNREVKRGQADPV